MLWKFWPWKLPQVDPTASFIYAALNGLPLGLTGVSKTHQRLQVAHVTGLNAEEPCGASTVRSCFTSRETPGEGWGVNPADRSRCSCSSEWVQESLALLMHFRPGWTFALWDINYFLHMSLEFLFFLTNYILCLFHLIILFLQPCQMMLRVSSWLCNSGMSPGIAQGTILSVD